MAGDWIKMRKNIYTDPRVVGIAERLRVHIDRVACAFHRLWSVADDISTDGRLDGYTAKTIDRIADVRGFSAAACEIGTSDHPPWLVMDATGATIPDFGKHMGDSWKQRERDRIRQKSHRERDKQCDKKVTVTALEAEQSKQRDRADPAQSRAGPDALASRAACLPACPDGDDAAVCIRPLIGDPKRKRLLASGVTAAMIREERDAIVADVTAGRVLGKPRGVLVRNLERRLGIAKGPQAIGGLVAAQTAGARLVQARRNAGVEGAP